MPLTKEAEEDQLRKEPISDEYRQLRKEIRLRDESVAFMTFKMDALMTQLQIASKGEPMLGASTTANPQPKSAYNPTAFSPLPQPVIPGGT